MDEAGSQIYSPQEVERGRVQAALSYVVPLYFLVPLRRRDNLFAVFHARQALGLWSAAVIAMFALSLGLLLLTIILLNVPVAVSTGLVSFGVLVMAGMWAVGAAKSAWHGRDPMVPYIGRFADEHFGKE